MPRSAVQQSGIPIIDQVTASITASMVLEGTGAPTALAGYAGQHYNRLDTPATANQRIYVCTVAGIAGAATWVGIV